MPEYYRVGNKDLMAGGVAGGDAVGTNSVAIFGTATTSGWGDIAAGHLAQAISGGGGSYNIAIGVSSVADNGYSTAIGNKATSKNYSVAIGASSFGDHSFSVAVGPFAKANGARSTAIGPYASSDWYGVALGSKAVAGRSEGVLGTTSAETQGTYLWRVPGRLEVGGEFVRMSPDGTRWNITVDDAGTVSAVAATT